MMSKCKSCGATIYWIKSPRGKWIPCDEKLVRYKEDRAGKDMVVSHDGEVIRCRLQFDGLPTGMARIAHWATCPNANQHRRRNENSRSE